MTGQRSIYDLEYQEMIDFLVSHECPAGSAPHIFQHLYKGLFYEKELASLMGLLSHKTLNLLKENFSFQLPVIEKIQESPDGTAKLLIAFADKRKVETVIIPFNHRYSICLSSQVGCAMNCSFCYTGLQGLTRHLSAGEILSQYLLAWGWLLRFRPEKAVKPKIVFMGQGEPLHNFDAVKKALAIFLCPEALDLGHRQITLSTAGYLPGLLRFQELHSVNLAVSLHSPFDDIRSRLIPLNKSYNLEKLFQVLRSIPLKKRQFINFEYLLIDGLNDRPEDARALAALLKDLKAIVNLIPFNEFPGPAFKRPSTERIEEFKKNIISHKIFVTIRTTKGSEILAACGQLNVKH